MRGVERVPGNLIVTGPYAGLYKVRFQLMKSAGGSGLPSPDAEGMLGVSKGNDLPFFVVSGVRWSKVLVSMKPLVELLWHLRMTESVGSEARLWVMYCMQELFGVAMSVGGEAGFGATHNAVPPVVLN